MSAGKVFISYRRNGGAALARPVHGALTRRGYDVYLDVEDSRAGAFDSALREAIQAATDAVVILSSGSLDRCWDEDDWFRAEVAHALAQNGNVIPILDQVFEWPSKPMPSDLAALRTRQGLTLSREYFEASMDKLVRELLVGRPSSPERFREHAAWGRTTTGAVPKHRGIRLLLGFGKRRIAILFGVGLLSWAAAVGLWFWSDRPVRTESSFAQQEAIFARLFGVRMRREAGNSSPWPGPLANRRTCMRAQGGTRRRPRS